MILGSDAMDHLVAIGSERSLVVSRFTVKVDVAVKDESSYVEVGIRVNT